MIAFSSSVLCLLDSCVWHLHYFCLMFVLVEWGNCSSGHPDVLVARVWRRRRCRIQTAVYIAKGIVFNRKKYAFHWVLVPSLCIQSHSLLSLHVFVLHPFCTICLQWISSATASSSRKGGGVNKQAYHMIHYPINMVSRCSLIPGCRLACRDQHRHTGSGSTLETLRDDALYKYTFTCTLLYFSFSSVTFLAILSFWILTVPASYLPVDCNQHVISR